MKPKPPTQRIEIVCEPGTETDAKRSRADSATRIVLWILLPVLFWIGIIIAIIKISNRH